MVVDCKKRQNPVKNQTQHTENQQMKIIRKLIEWWKEPHPRQLYSAWMTGDRDIKSFTSKQLREARRVSYSFGTHDYDYWDAVLTECERRRKESVRQA